MENLLYNEKALETSSCFIMIYGNLPLYSHFSVSRPNNWNGVGCALRIFLFFFHLIDDGCFIYYSISIIAGRVVKHKY